MPRPPVRTTPWESLPDHTKNLMRRHGEPCPRNGSGFNAGLITEIERAHTQLPRHSAHCGPGGGLALPYLDDAPDRSRLNNLLQSPKGLRNDARGDLVLPLVAGRASEKAGLDLSEAVLSHQRLDRFRREMWGWGRHVRK